MPKIFKHFKYIIVLISIPKGQHAEVSVIISIFTDPVTEVWKIESLSHNGKWKPLGFV